jgi:hypothetical protein
MRRYTLKVTDVLNWNGINCPADKTEINFEQPGCADIVCNPAANSIVVEIPDGCNESCFYAVVTCTQDCDGCGDRRIEICVCDSNVDCGPCSKCITEKSVCVSTCAPGLICSEECGGCAECDNQHPCSGGKICAGCKCVCPPSAPYQNENGQCINCAVDGHCPPCHKCTPEGCKPVNCPGSICDPATRDCVECLSRTDCKKPNECCEDKKCVCCPGYHRDVNGDCVPDGCKNDGDCAECETCDVPTGKCKPLICPPNQVCVPGRGCLPICDCENPLCDNQSPCVRLNETTCYCSGCSGDCSDGKPCGPGCYCDKSDMKCKPNPCKGGCTNGTECGPGCGCNKETLQCEPCASVLCGQPCDNLLGCGCPNGATCSDLVDCGQECVNGNSCPPGCGCYKGKCVRCENFTCADCANVDGCQCTDGVHCVSDNNKGCEDDATIVKNQENCSITAFFDIKSTCSCHVITTGIGHTQFTNTAGVLGTSLFVGFRKGIATDRTGYFALPLLDIMPESGVVKVIAYAIYKNGGLLKPKVKVDEKNVNVNLDAITIDNISLGSFTSGTDLLYSYEIEVFLSSKLKFSNDCEYDVKRIARITGLADQSSPSVNGFFTDQITSESKRKPMISWFRTQPGGGYGSAFRKAFIGKGTDGRYFDTLFGPKDFDPALDNWPLKTPEGNLYSGFGYKATTDCACEDASINDVVFCNLDKFQYTLNEVNCKKTLILNGNFTVCPVNDPTQSMPASSISNFELYLNGNLEYQWQGNLVSGFTITIDETITDVRLVQKIGARVVCERNYTHTNDLVSPVVNVDCDSSPEYVKVRIHQIQGGIQINEAVFGLKTITGNTFPTSMDPFTINGVFVNPIENSIPKSIVGENIVIIKITYTNGCSKIIELPKCSVEVIVTFDPNNVSYANCTPSGLNPGVEVTALGFNSNVKYSLDNGPLQVSNRFENVSPGVHSIRVFDGVSEKFVTIEVFPAASPNVYFTVPQICVNQSTKLVIEAPSGTQFLITTPTNTINATVIGSKYELPINYGPNVAGNYIVSLVGSGTQVCNGFQKTVVLTVGGQALNPTIEIMPGSYCVGSAIPFRILNGNGATFTVTSNGTGTITPTVLSGNSYNGTFTPNTTNGQIQITGLASGSECNTTTNPVLNVVVSASPVIVSVSSVCNPDNSHTITVTTTDATSVLIGGVAALNIGSGLWQRLGAIGLSGNIPVVAQNANCITTEGHDLPNCSCPTGTLLIEGDGNICGAGQVVFDYSVFHNQNPSASWNFVWQVFNAGVWSDSGVQAPYDNLNPPQFVYSLSTNQSITVRLKMVNTVNNCVYYSNELTQMSYGGATEPTISMSPNPAQVGTSVTFTAPLGYSTYQWKINGVNVGTSQNTYTYTPTVAGSVTVRVDVTDSNGCTAFKQSNFTIVANCPDVPIAYVPQSICVSSLQFLVTNNVGVLNYSYTGTGDNATVVSGSGVVPGSNLITVPITTLDPGETLAMITFTFTYTQGANPLCTVVKEVSINYENCANNLEIDLSGLTVGAGEFLFLTDGRFYPCGQPNTNEIPFWSNFGNNLGITTLVSNGNQEYMLDNNTACTDQQIVDAEFAPTPRTLVASIGALATEMQAKIQNKVGFEHVTVTGSGTTLTFNNVLCRVASRVVVIAYQGTMNGTCDDTLGTTDSQLSSTCSC